MNQAWIKALPAFIRTRIDGRPGLQRILTNTGWLLADKMLGMVISLFVGVWVVRYLGPEQLGLYSYALAFVAIFVPLSELGLRDITIRNIVRESSAKDEILGTAFALRLVGSILTLILIVSVATLLRPEDALSRWLIAIVAGTVVFYSLDTIDYWFQSQLQARYTVWAKKTAIVLVAVVKVVLILSQAPLIAFAWATLAEAALGAAGLVVLYHVSGQQLKAWRKSLWRARQLLTDSWPLIFSSFAIMVYVKADQIMLQNLAGEKELGIYAAAVRISELWYFIPTAVAASIYPAIVHTRQSQSQWVYRQRMQFFYDVMAGLGYAIAIPLSLVASPLVTMLFGAEYAEAGPILAVHVWSFVFVSLGVARSRWLLVENITRFYMFATILGVMANIGLNYWLIPAYAGLGAAWASLISYAVSGYLSCALWSRLWPVFGQLTMSLLVPFRPWALKKSLNEMLQANEMESAD